jgi:hypothetical protein
MSEDRSIFLGSPVELTKSWRFWKLMPLKELEQKGNAKAQE